MRRFRFTLESVLTVKQKTLEDERIKLASILNVLNKQKEILENIISNFKEINAQIDNCTQEGFLNIEMIANLKSYSIKLQSDIENQKKVVQNSNKEFENQQKITNKAYIEVKTLEKLKEKQKENYDKELIKEEFKLTDDLITSRFKNS